MDQKVSRTERCGVPPSSGFGTGELSSNVAVLATHAALPQAHARSDKSSAILQARPLRQSPCERASSVDTRIELARATQTQA